MKVKKCRARYTGTWHLEDGKDANGREFIAWNITGNSNPASTACLTDFGDSSCYPVVVEGWDILEELEDTPNVTTADKPLDAVSSQELTEVIMRFK